MTDTLPEPRPSCCSFCGKNQHEVRKLIPGPTVFICNECVAVCTDIIREVEAGSPLTQNEIEGYFILITQLHTQIAEFEKGCHHATDHDPYRRN